MDKACCDNLDEAINSIPAPLSDDQYEKHFNVSDEGLYIAVGSSFASEGERPAYFDMKVSHCPFCGASLDHL